MAVPPGAGARPAEDDIGAPAGARAILVTGAGSHVRAGGSGDEGVSDEGAVHDGQFGQNDESDVQLQQEETNQVDAESNTFGTTQRATPSAPSAMCPQKWGPARVVTRGAL